MVRISRLHPPVRLAYCLVLLFHPICTNTSTNGVPQTWSQFCFSTKNCCICDTHPFGPWPLMPRCTTCTRAPSQAPNHGCDANDWDVHQWDFKAAKLGGILFVHRPLCKQAHHELPAPFWEWQLRKAKRETHKISQVSIPQGCSATSITDLLIDFPQDFFCNLFCWQPLQCQLFLSGMVSISHLAQCRKGRREAGCYLKRFRILHKDCCSRLFCTLFIGALHTFKVSVTQSWSNQSCNHAFLTALVAEVEVIFGRSKAHITVEELTHSRSGRSTIQSQADVVFPDSRTRLSLASSGQGWQNLPALSNCTLMCPSYLNSIASLGHHTLLYMLMCPNYQTPTVPLCRHTLPWSKCSIWPSRYCNRRSFFLWTNCSNCSSWYHSTTHSPPRGLPQKALFWPSQGNVVCHTSLPWFAQENQCRCWHLLCNKHWLGHIGSTEWMCGTRFCIFSI